MKRLVEKLAPMPFWQQTFYLMVLATAVTAAVAVPLFTIGMIFDALRGPLVFLGFMAVAVIIITVDNRAHNKGVRRQFVLEAAPMVLFKVVCDAAMQLGILTPSTIEETRCYNLDRLIQTTPVLCFEFYKAKLNTSLDRNTLLLYKNILQHRIDKELAFGGFLIPQFISVGLTPAITVLSVQESASMLYIELAVAFDNKSADNIKEYKQKEQGPITNGKEQKPVPSIRVALDATLLKDSIEEDVMWPIQSAAHAAYIGETGSGKSTAVKIAIREALSMPDCSVILCDYKAEDFSFLKGKDGYYQGEECSKGLERAYDLLMHRKDVPASSRSFVLFVFDEWAAYISSFGEDKEGKRQAAEAKHKMAVLLMLSRSFNIHVLASQQRGDATFFDSARDNFGIVVALGNLSPQSRDMFFSGYKEDLEEVNGVGAGYMSINRGKPIAIQVPHIDIEQYDAKIAMFFRSPPAPPGGAGEA